VMYSVQFNPDFCRLCLKFPATPHRYVILPLYKVWSLSRFISEYCIYIHWGIFHSCVVCYVCVCVPTEELCVSDCYF
jgi:hypothetical protein